ncbi:MAG: dihydropteridine reductase [Ruminococcaceae bacterium]|nr:dihydropteridine reductase [Oscillospiraceae bacterium]
MNRNDKQFMAQKIRAQYMEKEITELDELRRLDAEVKRPANIFSYIFGSIGAIVTGCGMSLIMTDIADMINFGGDPMVAGIVIGIFGLAMALVNYPIYKAILNSRKKKYSAEILKLSEKIMNN